MGQKEFGTLGLYGAKQDLVLLANTNVEACLNDSFVPGGALALGCKQLCFSLQRAFFIVTSKETLEYVGNALCPQRRGSRLTSVTLKAGPGASALLSPVAGAHLKPAPAVVSVYPLLLSGSGACEC